jgi:hypothetical protein
MQHRRDGDLRTDPLGVGSDLQRRLGRRLHEEVVDDALVLESHVAQLGRQRVNDMEVADGQQICLALSEPPARSRTLIWWTAPAPGIESAIG